MDDIITTLATLYTQCEKQGYKCKVSLYGIKTQKMVNLSNKYKGSTYIEKLVHEDREWNMDCNVAKINMPFWEVLLFDKKL